MAVFDRYWAILLVLGSGGCVSIDWRHVLLGLRARSLPIRPVDSDAPETSKYASFLFLGSRKTTIATSLKHASQFCNHEARFER